ncbi:hypothetical protein EMIHUDRAFT_216640 [Emiliania huxleyi CCMP1516]|uniref:Uncharacterized protein n=2 Tax=Emiliania huxleyi TaxID=2903 RepID=A0A0D3IDC7_EMIH1|nr:hypothetical protein EMIHUDRAFT_220837 [Emiliania huxleyi CCMP1516]XP_005761691.1 hypothetical protein EMIHUDRAFT_216640 [Emiliania huxleyi CCMP1516]EOD04707.1 hypothetical protein EMIHUDRAFT_220837 [Emiliania huxleyi CCMP1516]EOD09262.1 hypothetical protein EMIHUDRAFT_216640 [Emiliania huxleyi CCMP1516]|eukprot:XP_005757136.1 hypothetical protein EMIHUDRAFT_220837 [Emiliania huxleyi CCMP1516]
MAFPWLEKENSTYTAALNKAFRQIRAREVLSKHAPPPVSSPWKGLHHTVQLGGDGLSPKPVFQRSARGLAPVDAAARRDRDEATLEAAASELKAPQAADVRFVVRDWVLYALEGGGGGWADRAVPSADIFPPVEFERNANGALWRM